MAGANLLPFSSDGPGQYTVADWLAFEAEVQRVAKALGFDVAAPAARKAAAADVALYLEAVLRRAAGGAGNRPLRAADVLGVLAEGSPERLACARVLEKREEIAELLNPGFFE